MATPTITIDAASSPQRGSGSFVMATMITVVLDAAAIAGISGSAMPAVATSIDEVIAQLGDAIEHSLRERSRLGFFAALYRKVTA